MLLKKFLVAQKRNAQKTIKPTINQFPDQIILHSGTNNLPSEDNLESTAENIQQRTRKPRQI